MNQNQISDNEILRQQKQNENARKTCYEDIGFTNSGLCPACKDYKICVSQNEKEFLNKTVVKKYRKKCNNIQLIDNLKIENPSISELHCIYWNFEKEKIQIFNELLDDLLNKFMELNKHCIFEKIYPNKYLNNNKNLIEVALEILPEEKELQKIANKRLKHYIDILSENLNRKIKEKDKNISYKKKNKNAISHSTVLDDKKNLTRMYYYLKFFFSGYNQDIYFEDDPLNYIENFNTETLNLIFEDFNKNPRIIKIKNYSKKTDIIFETEQDRNDFYEWILNYHKNYKE